MVYCSIIGVALKHLKTKQLKFCGAAKQNVLSGIGAQQGVKPDRRKKTRLPVNSNVIPKIMKNLLSAFLLAFTITGCISPEEIVVPEEISKLQSLTKSNCTTIPNEIKCDYYVVTNNINKVVNFLNARKKHWGYASTTFPGPKLIMVATLQNNETFEIYIGENWIGLGIGKKQVLQNLSEEELTSFKALLKIRL